MKFLVNGFGYGCTFLRTLSGVIFCSFLPPKKRFADHHDRWLLFHLLKGSFYNFFSRRSERIIKASQDNMRNHGPFFIRCLKTSWSLKCLQKLIQSEQAKNVYQESLQNASPTIEWRNLVIFKRHCGETFLKNLLCCVNFSSQIRQTKSWNDFGDFWINLFLLWKCFSMVTMRRHHLPIFYTNKMLMVCVMISRWRRVCSRFN